MKIRSAVICICLLLADQLTKHLADLHLKNGDNISLLPGVLEFSYVQNKGAAFGSLSGMRWPLILFAVIMIGAGIFLTVKCPAGKRFALYRMSLLLIMAGAAGNLIDRVLYGYVRDFIYFSLIDFPVFNVADIWVCVGCALLAVYLFFFSREEDRLV